MDSTHMQTLPHCISGIAAYKPIVNESLPLRHFCFSSGRLPETTPLQYTTVIIVT